MRGGGRGCNLRVESPVAGLWLPLRGRVQLGPGPEATCNAGEIRVSETEPRMRAVGRGAAIRHDILARFENVVGSAFGDHLIGDDKDNKLAGAAGDDTLTGGGGKDIFVFSSLSGLDTITDFEQADIIYLRDLWVSDIKDLFDNYMYQDGNDVVIDVFGDVLVIKDTLMAELDQNQFVIS